ncbi:uncharacterized protein LOC112544163 [Pelodiscus sinensis]|uniref:uncharacterized protein LOC112544163 n=1 Tax=Pelodiscus sinensis TaxID=13735 RepID=UPI003F6CFD1C
MLLKILLFDKALKPQTQQSKGHAEQTKKTKRKPSPARSLPPSRSGAGDKPGTSTAPPACVAVVPKDSRSMSAPSPSISGSAVSAVPSVSKPLPGTSTASRTSAGAECSPARSRSPAPRCTSKLPAEPSHSSVQERSSAPAHSRARSPALSRSSSRAHAARPKQTAPKPSTRGPSVTPGHPSSPTRSAPNRSSPPRKQQKEVTHSPAPERSSSLTRLPAPSHPSAPEGSSHHRFPLEGCPPALRQPSPLRQSPEPRQSLVPTQSTATTRITSSRTPSIPVEIIPHSVLSTPTSSPSEQLLAPPAHRSRRLSSLSPSPEFSPEIHSPSPAYSEYSRTGQFSPQSGHFYHHDRCSPSHSTYYRERSRSPRSPAFSTHSEYSRRSRRSMSPYYHQRSSSHHHGSPQASLVQKHSAPSAPSRPPTPSGSPSRTGQPRSGSGSRTGRSPMDQSSSSPDDAVFQGDTSPSDDLRQFQELFKRVAESQNVQLGEVQQKQHHLLRNIKQSHQPKISLPLDVAILEIADDIWQLPASAPPTNKKADKKYFVPAKGMEFLFTHPQPNSLVVDAVQQKAKMLQHKPTAADRDSKCLDLFGRKVYSSATLTLRMANYSALLANHNFDNYAKLVPLLQHLPEAKRDILKAVIQEGYAASEMALHIALDTADAAARMTATSVVMHRASWLQQSSAPKDLFSKVEDLPFDRQNLFSDKTDQLLHSGKDSRTTLKMLGMYTPPYRRKRYTPYQRQRPLLRQPPQYRPQDQQRGRQHQQRRHPPPKTTSQQGTRQQV